MSRPDRPLAWRAAFTLALRDLRGGLRGLRLLVTCLFLGVATLAAIGSLTDSLTGELADRGQRILGGDVELSVAQRLATAEEKAAFAAAGRLSETVRLRAMAQRSGPPDAPDAGDGPVAVLAEFKAVDAAWPLYGTATTSDGAAIRPTADTVYIAPALADRLALGVGDSIRFGTADYRIAGLIGSEPDRVGEGFTLGPVAITSIEGLARSNLVQPGSMFTAKYRLRLPAGADARAAADTLDAAHKAAGWSVRDRFRAAPGAGRFLERMGQFLSLIGLAAMVIAGIGVGNGVASYLDMRRPTIATLKIVGATSTDIGRTYVVQLGLVVIGATFAGLVVGAAIPPLLIAAFGDALPVQPGFRLAPAALALAGAFGLIVAAMFTALPLARARVVPAAALLRAHVGGLRRVEPAALAVIIPAALLLVALVLVTSAEPVFSAVVLAAVAAVLLLLLLIGVAVRRTAARLPRPQRPLLRLAIANLHRPGAQTGALVVALGLALTLFVTLAAIQTSLSANIARTVPARAPSQFILDIPATERDAFAATVRAVDPSAVIAQVPALRGTITAYGDQRVADLSDLPAGAWFLRGDRGVTYAATLPEGSSITAGEWWPAGYSGPPLVSLDEEAATILGIGVGDTITVSVLGREVTARIASLRRIDWDTMGFNYILVFDPATFAAAPHTLAATIDTSAGKEGRIARAILSRFPSVSVIPVGEVLGQVSTILGQMASAIVAAASITILAGIAVLVGAIAATRSARAYDSVLLKLLGATSRQVLLAQMAEYALLAATLCLVALVLGGLGAWYVVTGVFDFAWLPDWGVIAAVLGGGAVLTLGIALAGSLPLMRVRTAQALRDL